MLTSPRALATRRPTGSGSRQAVTLSWVLSSHAQSPLTPSTQEGRPWARGAEALPPVQPGGSGLSRRPAVSGSTAPPLRPTAAPCSRFPVTLAPRAWVICPPRSPVCVARTQPPAPTCGPELLAPGPLLRLLGPGGGADRLPGGGWAQRGCVPDVGENSARVPPRGGGWASPWGLPGVGAVTAAALPPKSEGPGGMLSPRLGHQPGTPAPPRHRAQAGSAGVSPLSPRGTPDVVNAATLGADSLRFAALWVLGSCLGTRATCRPPELTSPLRGVPGSPPGRPVPASMSPPAPPRGGGARWQEPQRGAEGPLASSGSL